MFEYCKRRIKEIDSFMYYTSMSLYINNISKNVTNIINKINVFESNMNNYMIDLKEKSFIESFMAKK